MDPRNRSELSQLWNRFIENVHFRWALGLIVNLGELLNWMEPPDREKLPDQFHFLVHKTKIPHLRLAFETSFRSLKCFSGDFYNLVSHLKMIDVY